MRGFDLAILETYRSPARQRLLFEKRLTELRNVGVHGYGLAIDFGLFKNGVYDPRGRDYMVFKDYAKQCGILSGIDWGEPCVSHSFHDWDHLQGVPLFRQNDLFAGKWYPSDDYDAWADEKARGIKIV